MKEKDKQFIPSLQVMKAAATSSFFDPVSEYLNGILLQAILQQNFQPSPEPGSFGPVFSLLKQYID